MNRATATCAVILISVSAAAWAQTTSSAPGIPTSDPIPVNRFPARTSASLSRPDGSGVQKEIANSLRQAGFRNIRIVPQAFIIQATSQTGDPVTMFLSPDLLKVFVAQDAEGSDTITASSDQPAGAPTK